MPRVKPSPGTGLTAKEPRWAAGAADTHPRALCRPQAGRCAREPGCPVAGAARRSGTQPSPTEGCGHPPPRGKPHSSAAVWARQRRFPRSPATGTRSHERRAWSLQLVVPTKPTDVLLRAVLDAQEPVHGALSLQPRASVHRSSPSGPGRCCPPSGHPLAAAEDGRQAQGQPRAAPPPFRYCLRRLGAFSLSIAAASSPLSCTCSRGLGCRSFSRHEGQERH